MAKHGIVIDVDLSNLPRACNLKMADRQFALNAKEEADGKRVAEMLLYDVIGQAWDGEGLTAKRVEDELKALGEVDEINVLINSPGGVIYEALGIYNALVRNPAKVITTNVGAAWSCAGWLLQAGDERRATENSTLMIHNSQGFVMGDRRDFIKQSEVLDKMDDTIAVTFARRTNRKADTFRKMMDEETWFDAKESLDNRLIDVLLPAKSSAKNLDPKAYGFMFKTNSVEPAEKDDDTNEPEAADRSTEVATRLRLLELEAG